MCATQGSVIECPDCGHGMMTRDGILEVLPEHEYDCGAWDRVYDPMDVAAPRLFKMVSRGLANPGLLDVYYPIVRLLKGSGRSFKTSIELGAGSGTYSLVLKKLGLVEHVTLLDYSRDALLMAQALFQSFGETCQLVHSRVEDAPFRDKAFDLAFSGGLIEHYETREERLACLSDHCRLASTVYLQAPVDLPAYWVQRRLITALKGAWPFGFERPVSEQEIRDLAGSAGATVSAWDYHYFASFLVFYLPLLARIVPNIRMWIFQPLRMDIACLLECAHSATTAE
ncbi:MAG: class I SAM-dependent methyltransferase [Candidatus Geothermincolia bacterium]